MTTEREMSRGRAGVAGVSGVAGVAGAAGMDDLLADGADDVFSALADRTRRRILVRLAEAPDDAGAVARDLNLSRQAVAKHLRILEGTGLVGATRDSRRRVHTVEPARIREISDLLGLVAHGWDRRLATIKELAEAQERREGSPSPSRRPRRR